MNPDREGGPYTTLTVDEYNHLQAVVLGLRKRQQTAREFLEQGMPDAALALLRQE